MQKVEQRMEQLPRAQSKHERFGAASVRIFPSILRQAQDERENPYQSKTGKLFVTIS
jgi:hypothetical protein